MYLKEIKAIYHKELDSHYPKEEVSSFFHLLVEHFLGMERFVLAVRPDIVVTKAQEQPLFEALSDLKRHRPVQYIMGETQFMDLNFHVNESVLIPRPETEELVRWILEDLTDNAVKSERAGDKKIAAEQNNSKPPGIDQKEINSKPRIFDIGTGSGCIAISLAKNLQGGEVQALELSTDALKTAEKNGSANKVTVKFTQGDITSLESLGIPFDIIVSNPPYVRESEKEQMHANVLDYEPDLALFVTDEEPLLYYRSILRFASRNLTLGGSLYLEINQYLAKEMQQLLEEYNFTDIEVRKDIFGNDRIVKGRYY